MSVVLNLPETSVSYRRMMGNLKRPYPEGVVLPYRQDVEFSGFISSLAEVEVWARTKTGEEHKVDSFIPTASDFTFTLKIERGLMILFLKSGFSRSNAFSIWGTNIAVVVFSISETIENIFAYYSAFFESFTTTNWKDLRNLVGVLTNYWGGVLSLQLREDDDVESFLEWAKDCDRAIYFGGSRHALELILPGSAAVELSKLRPFRLGKNAKIYIEKKALSDLIRWQSFIPVLSVAKLVKL